MKVQFKHQEREFRFNIGDDVTIVEDYLNVEDPEDEKIYRGILTKVETDGIRVKLENETEEDYFRFVDIENVLPGDRIPMFNGSTKRLKKEI